MLTSEDIKLLSQLMDEKLKPINERLDTIEENTEITRVATNEVIKWIDKYFREDYPFSRLMINRLYKKYPDYSGYSYYLLF